MVPLVDLRAQYASLRTEVLAAIERVMESGQFVLGPETEAFEREFAVYCQTSYAVGTNSGTSALHLALLAAGVGPGDEVITVPFTFVATAAAIGYTGARPVFVDVRPDSLTMDPELIEAAVTSRTRAIVPVHLYGQPADMGPITEIARARGLKVVEDACQAHGAEYRGRRAGSLGDLGCFSFYPGKNLGAYGEAGAVVTDDPELARSIGVLRHWGQERRYHHDRKGFNYRIEELQAALLRVKLRHLEEWTASRRAHARLYRELLEGVVPMPAELPYARHVFHLYVIRTAARTALEAALSRAGIQSGVHYPVPVHLQPAWAELGYRRGDFPVTECASREVLSLPMFAELREATIGRIVDVVASQREPTWPSA